MENFIGINNLQGLCRLGEVAEKFMQINELAFCRRFPLDLSTCDLNRAD